MATNANMTNNNDHDHESDHESDGNRGSYRFLIWNEKGWWKQVQLENEEKEIHTKITRIARDTRNLIITSDCVEVDGSRSIETTTAAATTAATTPTNVSFLFAVSMHRVLVFLFSFVRSFVLVVYASCHAKI